MENSLLCLCLNRGLGLPDAKQIRLLKETGFDGFFAVWSESTDLGELKRVAAETETVFQSVHAPYCDVGCLWSETDPQADSVLSRLTACLNDCAAHEIPLMVSHATMGFGEAVPTQAGIERFGRLVDRARVLGVQIAFENAEGDAFLAAVMQAFAGEKTVGFCWDTGHNQCYSHEQNLMQQYGDRILGTHLNDNLGVRAPDGTISPKDDLHLLPFDGIVDWPLIAHSLAAASFTRTLTFELKRSVGSDLSICKHYEAMTPQEYVGEAFRRAWQVAALVRRAQAATNPTDSADFQKDPIR